MNIQVFDTFTEQNVSAQIEKATAKDMPLKKDDWQFAWRSLYKIEGAEFYKLVLTDSPIDIQGILMLTLMNDEMLYMNNIEIAPHNYGSKGRYEHVAGCLIAYSCLRSFVLGKNHYKGFLTFESKTALIPLYQEKYGAERALGQRMFISKEKGIELITKYLGEDTSQKIPFQ